MAQHFQSQPQDVQSDVQSSEGGTNPRAQRMTADEASAVTALWQAERVEQTGLTDKPAAADVAEGLDVSLEDVRRLLTEVRARRVEEERALANEQALSEIRLAEEERKLAEIRRQRAELRREQAEAARRQAEATTESQQEQSLVYIASPVSDSDTYSSLGPALILGIAVLLIILIAVFGKAVVP